MVRLAADRMGYQSAGCFFLFPVRNIGNIDYDKKPIPKPIPKPRTKNQRISETACFVGSKDNSK